MVNDALGLVFVEHRTGMYSDAQHGFGCFVYIFTVVSGAVSEESTGYAFPNVGVLIVFVNA